MYDPPTHEFPAGTAAALCYSRTPRNPRHGRLRGRADPAGNSLGGCPAHQKTGIPGFRPGIPVFRYAEFIPQLSGALRARGEPICCDFIFAEVAETWAPALWQSAFGRSHCATTSFLTFPPLPHRRASLRLVGDPCAMPSLQFSPLSGRPRQPARQPLPARTTDNNTATTQHRRPPARPFKLDALGDTYLMMVGWLWARGTGVGRGEIGKSSFSIPPPLSL